MNAAVGIRSLRMRESSDKPRRKRGREERRSLGRWVV
jgi:hypothetical protein